MINLISQNQTLIESEIPREEVNLITLLSAFWKIGNNDLVWKSFTLIFAWIIHTYLKWHTNDTDFADLHW